MLSRLNNSSGYIFHVQVLLRWGQLHFLRVASRDGGWTFSRVARGGGWTFFKMRIKISQTPLPVINTHWLYPKCAEIFFSKISSPCRLWPRVCTQEEPHICSAQDTHSWSESPTDPRLCFHCLRANCMTWLGPTTFRLQVRSSKNKLSYVSLLTL